MRAPVPSGAHSRSRRAAPQAGSVAKPSPLTHATGPVPGPITDARRSRIAAASARRMSLACGGDEQDHAAHARRRAMILTCPKPTQPAPSVSGSEAAARTTAIGTSSSVPTANEMRSSSSRSRTISAVAMRSAAVRAPRPDLTQGRPRLDLAARVRHPLSGAVASTTAEAGEVVSGPLAGKIAVVDTGPPATTVVAAVHCSSAVRPT